MMITTGKAPLSSIAMIAFCLAPSLAAQEAHPGKPPARQEWEAMEADMSFDVLGLTLESRSSKQLAGAWFKRFEGEEGYARARLRIHEWRDPRRWVALAFRGRGGEQPRFDLFTVRVDPSGRSGLEIAQRENGRFRVLHRTRLEGSFDPRQSHDLEVFVRGSHVLCKLDGRAVLENWCLPAGEKGRFGIVASGARVSLERFSARRLKPGECEEYQAANPTARVAIVGHRGASRDAPENTLAAMRLAVERGADGVEFDVWNSGDGRAVIMHDATLARTTDVERLNEGLPAAERLPARIQEASYEQLRRLDAGSWKDERFRGERVPLLSEALELVRGHAVAVIEIKDPATSPEVARRLRELDMVGGACVISFHPEALEQIHAALPEVTTALLVGGEVPGVCGAKEAEALVARARKAHASCLSVNWKWVTPPFAERVRKLGMSLACWTVDDLEIARYLRRCGVEMITTNTPGELLRGLPAEKDSRGR